MENIIPYIDLDLAGSTYRLRYAHAENSSPRMILSSDEGEFLFRRSVLKLFNECGTVACTHECASFIRKFCEFHCLTCPSFTFIIDFWDYKKRIAEPATGEKKQFKELSYIGSSVEKNLSLGQLEELLLSRYYSDKYRCVLCELIPTEEYAIAVCCDYDPDFCIVYTIKELSRMFSTQKNFLGKPLINLSYFYDKYDEFKFSDSYIKSRITKNRSTDYQDL